MKKVLYIIGNPRSLEESSSLKVAEEFLKTYQSLNPSDEVTKLDLYNMDLPSLDDSVFKAWGKLQTGTSFAGLDPHEQAKVGRLGEIADQFVAADYYVFITPMWNFSFPSKVKDYIDAIVSVGKTFKYTDKGPVGLLENKKLVHIHSSGGIYSSGPAAEVDFADRYLRSIARFIGINDIQTVRAEGAAYMPNKAGEILEQAKADAREAAKNLSSGDLIAI